MPLKATFDGFTYSTNDPVFQWHIERGLSEPYPRHLKVIQKYLKMFPHKNQTALDIGGHIGTTCLPYSKLYKNIYTFEPNKESYNFLVENILLNNLFQKIHPYLNGVYNKSTFCKVVKHSNANSGCFMIKEVSEKENDDGSAIKVVKLDDISKDFTGSIDFLKIDTEGSELYVLEGAFDILKTHKPLIQVETNELSDKYFGYGKEKIFELLTSIGYILFDNSDTSNLFFYCPNDTLCITPPIRKVFSFWTEENPLTPARIFNLNNLHQTIEAELLLVTPMNLDNFILQAHPLHPSFPFLSAVHKADYLRTYFMHFFGGGYTDIKRTTRSWKDSFETLYENKDIIAIGYEEENSGCIAYEPHKPFYKDLIGNCAYIFRPNTALTLQWYNNMIQLLDKKFPILKENPAKHPYDQEYPIEWNEMLGRIFHNVSLSFKDSILKTLPKPIFHSYR